jgi:teichuronic acid biosynthesis glycosyltransferase TuaC
MKIIWVHKFNLNIKGGGIFMFQQIPFLKKKDIEVNLVDLNEHLSIRFIIELFFFKRFMFKEYIVHAQYGSGTAFFTSFLNAKKKIVSIRGSDWYLIPFTGGFKNFLHSKISIFLTRISLKNFDEIIVMSHSMRNEILSYNLNYKSKIHVVTDGIDLNKFYPIDKVLAKNQIGVNPFLFFVGVGSIQEGNSIKRIYLVKKAVEILKKKYPIEIHVLTGINPDEMNLHINVCDIMVLTSIYEGWPNIIKEGLACNVPFLSTDVSDLHEIANEKSSGCLICTDDIDDITRKLEVFYLENLKNKTYLTRKFVENLNIITCVDNLIEIYKK